MARESTRLAIIEQALADTLERLGELPSSAHVRALSAKALSYQRRVREWVVSPPSEQQRSLMVDLVLELNIAVMKAAEDAGAL
jgi:hypothetical protein